MRQLTLILSDLYFPNDEGPAEAGPPSEQSGFTALSEFEWLLRFATQCRAIEDWRSALAELSGAPQLASIPPAPFAAQFAAPGHVPTDRIATCWFATPVNLEARLDHVRLGQRGILRLPAEERRAWCEEFARSFGPGLVLHEGGPRGFFLSGLAAPGAVTVDPARVLGGDIAASLARGENSVALRRLSSEVEMWLHGAALNRERERARLPTVSSLWTWGGGQGAPAVSIARAEGIVYGGDDPWLVALARARTGTDILSAPDHFQDFAPHAVQGIFELTTLSDSAGGLARLDASWFGRARAALASGALDRVDILANDRHFTTHRRAGWRFWRRGQHWMDLLRRSDQAAQA